MVCYYLPLYPYVFLVCGKYLVTACLENHKVLRVEDHRIECFNRCMYSLYTQCDGSLNNYNLLLIFMIYLDNLNFF